MAVFSKKKISFAIVVKFLNMIGFILRSSEELRAKSIILENFIIVAKLFFLMTAANDKTVAKLVFC